MPPDAVPRRFRLIVFDWDGTLVDSTSIIARALQAACRDVGEPMPEDARATYVIGLGLADALAHVAPALPRERHAELADRYRSHYLGAEGNIPLFGGAADLLAELAAAGFMLAVATGKPARASIARWRSTASATCLPRRDARTRTRRSRIRRCCSISCGDSA